MSDELIHFHRGGTSVIVDLGDSRLPRILHWGQDLGDLSADDLAAVRMASQPLIIDSAITYPQPVPVLPQLAEGWLGRPGLSGSREGRGFAPLFLPTGWWIDQSIAVDTLIVDGEDATMGLSIRIEIELTEAGVLRIRASVTNEQEGPYRLDSLELALPVPDIATELLDLAGRWSREREPQRAPFRIGQWVRESRGGKPGFDAPTVMMAGTPAFGFRSGRVWGAHLGWSGNQVLTAERTASGVRLLRGGELLLPDEVTLEAGESITSPWLYGSWGDGIDDLSSRFHRFVRGRATHPISPRPVLVNTWEAMYFDLSTPRLLELVEASAEIGVERFVVDDGWFSGRTDDRSSLGDWTVDHGRLPDGLAPVAARVHELGMQFGLWFEPEMINVDSDLAREHPEWIFDAGHGIGAPSRYQHVLNLGLEPAYQHILERMREQIATLGIDYIKWDHNRFLTDAGDPGTGRAGVRAQTLAVYRLMDDLRASSPGLEIESCSSGGGRIDLGILEHTDRVWPSDCIDPHERLDIMRWTGILVPPELLGSHIGSEESHTTQRKSNLGFRGAIALWGHLGLELDLTQLDVAERDQVRAWVQLHQHYRDLLHAGRLVHADRDASTGLHGVVAEDGSHALYQFSVLARDATWPPSRLRLPGLELNARYRVTHVAPHGDGPLAGVPPWLAEGAVLTGRALDDVGLEAPSITPDAAVLLLAERLATSEPPSSVPSGVPTEAAPPRGAP